MRKKPEDLSSSWRPALASASRAFLWLTVCHVSCRMAATPALPFSSTRSAAAGSAPASENLAFRRPVSRASSSCGGMSLQASWWAKRMALMAVSSKTCRACSPQQRQVSAGCLASHGGARQPKPKASTDCYQDREAVNTDATGTKAELGGPLFILIFKENNTSSRWNQVDAARSQLGCVSPGGRPRQSRALSQRRAG